MKNLLHRMRKRLSDSNSTVDNDSLRTSADRRYKSCQLVTASWLLTVWIVCLFVANCIRAADAPPTETSAASPISASLGYQVDPFTGQFNYTVPIVVPPARQGASPKLGLTYQSSAGNGWCGVGWKLEMGRIERSSKFGVPIKWNGASPLSEYDDSKGFVLTFGGTAANLVPIGSDSYQAEVEGAFLIINFSRSANSWVVCDKSGNSFYFGESTASRLENSRWSGSIPQTTFAWALNRVVDPNGNKTDIAYTKDAGNLYPSTINYNGNVNTPELGAFHVIYFTLESRFDRPISYRMGFRSQLNYRLKKIETKVSHMPAHSYLIEYLQPSPSTARS